MTLEEKIQKSLAKNGYTSAPKIKHKSNQVIDDSVKEGTFKDLAEHLGTWTYNNGVLTPFLSFQIGGEKDGVYFSTHIKESNYFMSFKHTHSGAGSANEFTITLVFDPKPGDDISKMEKLFNTTKCYYRYGWDQPYMLSPLYQGILLNYSISMNNNLITYTLTGYGSVVAGVDLEYTLPAVGEYEESENDDGETVQVIKDGIRPTDYLATYVQDILDKNPTKNGVKNKILIDKSAENKDREVVIPGYSDITLSEALDEILSLAYTLDSDGCMELSQFYYYIVPANSDNDNTNQIIIKKLKSETGNITPEINFNWGTVPNASPKTSNIVKNFSAQYDGTIAIATASSSTDLAEYKYSINENGSVVRTRVIAGNSKIGANRSLSQIQSYNKWASGTQYSYEATLDLIGIPCEIPMGTYIRVTPVIYGTQHHTGGVYFVQEQTDTLDSNGFSTSLSLLKVCVNEVPKLSPKVLEAQKASEKLMSAVMTSSNKDMRSKVESANTIKRKSEKDS